MQRILKYLLPMDSSSEFTFTTIEMPRGAKVLHVAAQAARVFLWALVDDANPLERREFNIYSTGYKCPELWNDYVGTAHCGLYVWHVFEVTPRVHP